MNALENIRKAVREAIERDPNATSFYVMMQIGVRGEDGSIIRGRKRIRVSNKNLGEATKAAALCSHALYGSLVSGGNPNLYCLELSKEVGRPVQCPYSDSLDRMKDCLQND